MTSKRYAILGWITWRVAARVARQKVAQNKAKLGAVGVAALLVPGGILAARSNSG